MDLTPPRLVMDVSEEAQKKHPLGTVVASDGHSNEVKPVLEKADSPMVFTPPRLVIEASEDAPLKQSLGTVVAFDGHSNEVKPVLEKADSPMAFTALRLVIAASEPVSKKADSPMVFTPPRLVIEASEEAPWKQDLGTVVASDGHSNEERPLLLKAHAPTVTTFAIPVMRLSNLHEANACGGMALTSSGT